MKNVPNNCGINEKMMSEILRDIAIKKDGVSGLINQLKRSPDYNSQC